jgi:hypothetical protein
MCDFPAAQLLAYQRRLARECDTTDDPGLIRARMEAALHVQQLRLAHEDVDGCKCWYAAVKP